MLIRNFFLSAALCLMFSAVSCSSNTPSEYPSKDHDRAERNMERENREKESKPPRDMKMAAKQLGVSPEALRDALGRANGVTAYHLHTLESTGQIISWRDGKLRRYAVSSLSREEISRIRNPIAGTRLAILEVLAESGN